jgi:glyoxylase-like metal-dependent hydrolase (beta-lactamase superfamily II)
MSVDDQLYRVLAPGISYMDLEFLGLARAQATAVVRAPGSVALVDPGPSTCLERLERGLQAQGLQLRDVTDILITHIHLDHAGATGTIVRRFPHIRVYVHERGAEHLLSPAKLIDSATRYFGAANMERFWGKIAVVPEHRLTILRGGEQIHAGGRTFDVAYTPGHAVHHVSYFDASSGVAFVGDTGGLCIRGGYVLPPTPPPDIDVEAWAESIDRIVAWQPRTAFIAHFGPVRHVQGHLQTMLSNLHWMAGWVKASLSEAGTDEERSRRFGAVMRAEIRRLQDSGDIASYEPTSPLEALWFGLARYWRRNVRSA